MVPKLVKKLPVFYATQKLITVLNVTHHFSLSRARLVHSAPSKPIYWRQL